MSKRLQRAHLHSPYLRHVCGTAISETWDDATPLHCRRYLPRSSPAKGSEKRYDAHGNRCRQFVHGAGNCGAKHIFARRRIERCARFRSGVFSRWKRGFLRAKHAGGLAYPSVPPRREWVVGASGCPVFRTVAGYGASDGARWKLHYLRLKSTMGARRAANQRLDWRQAANRERRKSLAGRPHP